VCGARGWDTCRAFFQYDVLTVMRRWRVIYSLFFSPVTEWRAGQSVSMLHLTLRLVLFWQRFITRSSYSQWELAMTGIWTQLWAQLSSTELYPTMLCKGVCGAWYTSYSITRILQPQDAETTFPPFFITVESRPVKKDRNVFLINAENQQRKRDALRQQITENNCEKFGGAPFNTQTKRYSEVAKRKLCENVFYHCSNLVQ